MCERAYPTHLNTKNNYSQSVTEIPAVKFFTIDNLKLLEGSYKEFILYDAYRFLFRSGL